MKSCLYACILFFLFTACADEMESSPVPEASLPDSTNKAKQFFPILDYLRGQVKDVDSFSAAIKFYLTTNDKTDSGYMQLDQFKTLMQEFLPPELSKENFEKYYTESSFFDQTTQTSTFTYSTKNDELDFHRIDVLVQGTETYDRVSSIYMEKFTDHDDSSVLKKMLLRDGQMVMINSETTVGKAKPQVKQEKLVWGMSY
jgi:hypothetical protein